MGARLFIAGQHPLLVDGVCGRGVTGYHCRTQIRSSAQKDGVLLFQSRQRLCLALDGNVVLGAPQPLQEFNFGVVKLAGSGLLLAQQHQQRRAVLAFQHVDHAFRRQDRAKVFL